MHRPRAGLGFVGGAEYFGVVHAPIVDDVAQFRLMSEKCIGAACVPCKKHPQNKYEYLRIHHEN